MDPDNSYIANINSSPAWADLIGENNSGGVESWALWRTDDMVVSVLRSALPGEYLTRRLLIDGSGTWEKGHSAIHTNLWEQFPVYTGTSNPNIDPGSNTSVMTSVAELLMDILGDPQAPPANDSCATPTFISGAGQWAFDTRYATGPDANPGCGPGFDNDVWFAWTAGATGTVDMNVCNANFDTALALWRGHGSTGAGCTFNELDLYACNDDACGWQSQVTFPVVQGVTYMVQIGGSGALDLGFGSLSISVDGTGLQGMVYVPGGGFQMGDHSGQGYGHEVPIHPVIVNSFYMDVYEVTNQTYAMYLNSAYGQGRVQVSNNVVYQVGGAGQALCDTTDSSGYSRITWNGSTFGVTAGKEDHPMVSVSWYGAGHYANWRSREDGFTPCYDESDWSCNFAADGYRLPTEAEWEYAARGGEDSPYLMYPWGNTIDGSQANYSGSGDPFEGPWPETTNVGYYDGNQIPAGIDMANGYGLYDMSGNVWEWCGDWYSGVYYQACFDQGTVTNPTGPTGGSSRVARGGGWPGSPSYLRSAGRFTTYPTYRYNDLGFRLLAVRP